MQESDRKNKLNSDKIKSKKINFFKSKFVRNLNAFMTNAETRSVTKENFLKFSRNLNILFYILHFKLSCSRLV